MYPTYRRLAMLATTAAIVLFASACGNTKAAQCNKLIDTINESMALTKEFEQENKDFFANQDKNPTPTQAAKLVNNAADVIEALVEELKVVSTQLAGIDLKDAQLIQYRDDYSKNLTEFSGGLNDGANTFRGMGQLFTSISNVNPKEITSDKRQQIAKELSAAQNNILSAGQTSQTAGNEVDKIAKEINTYCGRETPAEGGDDGESGGDSGEGGDTAE